MIRESLLAEANSTHSQYPQYANYWDNWQLAVVVKPIKDKWGQTMLVVGDHVLAAPAERAGGDPATEAVIYIPSDKHWTKHGMNTRVRRSQLRIVD
jgi:hypothetical protein